jgi:phosphomannomutase
MIFVPVAGIILQVIIFQEKIQWHIKIKFGTDGWRGVIAEDYTFDNLRRCAQGFASYMLSQGKQGQWIVVGHDMRFGSEISPPPLRKCWRATA